MVNESVPGASAQTTRSKRRLITSCSECYRRKQKCDRTRPCNFCSSRNVPELCHYDEDFKRNKSKIGGSQSHENPRSVSTNNEESHAPIVSDASYSLADQVGYSPASRRDQLHSVAEYTVSASPGVASKEDLAIISNTNAYKNLLGRLPSENIANGLIQFHFSADDWSFPVLDEHRFRDLHAQFCHQINEKVHPSTTKNLPPLLTTFPALLFAVLASALQFTDPNTDLAHAVGITTIKECDTLSRYYIDTGQEIVELLRQQKPTTTSIEYHLVKMAWLKNNGRGGEAWQSLGIALRQAQEIDLHQIQEDEADTSSSSIEQTLTRLWELEHRKRLWARIFIIDSHMAVALGRPRGIHREDCSTINPLDCDYPPNPSQTVPMSTNHTSKPPSSFSSMMFSIELSHKYHDMMSLRASRLDLKDYSSIQSLHNEILTLLSGLPPAIRPSFPDTTWDRHQPALPSVRLRLLTMTNVFLLALHRPYVTTHIASRYAAIRAALAILQAQQDLFLSVPQVQHKLYGYSFYTIDAGIFLAAIVMKYSNFDLDISTRALQALQQAVSRLGCMKDRSEVAKTGEIVLQRCCTMIGTNTPSSSITSYDGVEAPEGAMNLENVNFLQDYGANIPDQATHDLLSFLADPSTSVMASSSTNLPADGGTSTGTNFSQFASVSLDAMGSLDSMTFDQRQWQT